jgi:hypothetical protein
MQDPTIFLQTANYNIEDSIWFADRYDTLDAAISWLQDIKDTAQRYENYLQALQMPYNNFLQHRLLPSLFIWQDPYTKQIDTQLVGRRFIQENPFTDTALIQYWSNFFRNVGDGTDFILIKDMKLWNIEEWPALFTIPISVSFTAPSKRAFLLLVDKLSLTSQEATISLINQFFFHIQVAMREKIQDDETITDKNYYIWRYIYNRVFENTENSLLDEHIIRKAIQETAQCQLLNTDTCLYNFRNIYRNIPQLAYGVWLVNDTTSIQSLKRFLQDLPPVITIAEFNFQRVPTRVWTQSQYEWSVVIHMHGKSIKDDDVNQVAYILWNQCIWWNNLLSPQLALDAIDTYLRRIADSQLTQQQSTQLLQLRRIIAEEEIGFWSMSNYNKVIKLFEMQRMLIDAGICRQ